MTTIVDTVLIENKRVAQVEADPMREYVAGSSRKMYEVQGQAQSLPASIDDVTEDFGDDLYERMVRDPQIESSIHTLKTSVLEEGIRLIVTEVPEGDSRQVLAHEIEEFCSKVFSDMDTPFNDALWNLLDAIYLGSKTAELVWKDAVIDGKARLVISKIHPKPRGSVAYVVDSYMNVLGLLAVQPSQRENYSSLTLTLGKIEESEMLPLEKFIVWSFRPKDGDPRGTSILRAIYNAWWIKQQLYPEWLKFLSQFATPSVLAKTGPGAQPTVEYDASGNPIEDPITGMPKTISPQQVLLSVLQGLKNGSAIVVPAGTEFEVWWSKGEGQAFLVAFGMLDAWISKTILHQTLATGEGEHQARAAAEVHQDILGVAIRAIKLSLAGILKRDVLRPLVKYNFGEEALDLVPDVSFGETESQDFPTTANAVGMLHTNGYLHPTHYIATDVMLGLEPRPQEAIDAMMATLEMGEVMARSAVTAMGNNNPGGLEPKDPQDAEAPPDEGIEEKATFSALSERMALEDDFTKSLERFFAIKKQALIKQVKLSA